MDAHGKRNLMTDSLITPVPSERALETRIAYVLVQDSEVQRYSSVFRLVPEANIRLLRSFMALALLPGDARRIRSGGRRSRKLEGEFEQRVKLESTGSRDKPDDVIWSGNVEHATRRPDGPVSRSNLVEVLARERPAVVLSQSETPGTAEAWECFRDY